MSLCWVLRFCIVMLSVVAGGYAGDKHYIAIAAFTAESKERRKYVFSIATLSFQSTLELSTEKCFTLVVSSLTSEH